MAPLHFNTSPTREGPLDTKGRRSHFLLLGWGCGRRRSVEVDDSPLLDFCCFLAGGQAHAPEVHAEITARFFADAEPLADLLAHGGSPAAARHAVQAVVDEARDAASASEHLVVRFTEQDAWAPESQATGGTIGEASAESLHEPWIGHGSCRICGRGHLAFVHSGLSFLSFFLCWIETVPSRLHSFLTPSGRDFRTHVCVRWFRLVCTCLFRWCVGRGFRFVWIGREQRLATVPWMGDVTHPEETEHHRLNWGERGGCETRPTPRRNETERKGEKEHSKT